MAGIRDHDGHSATTVIVPVSYYYRFTKLGSGGISIRNWAELRGT
jgi:hypothetical protein